MSYKINNLGSSLIIEIDNPIMSFLEVQDVREAIKSSNLNSIVLNFTNSTAMIPSSLIGTLLKLVHVDGKSVVIKTISEDLVEMLRAFKIDGIIKVEKI